MEKTETKYSTLKENVRESWLASAKVEGLPETALYPKVRILRNPDDEKGYSFGLIHNPLRKQRYNEKPSPNLSYNCHLCNAIELAGIETERDLTPGKIEGYKVVMNKFPVSEGMSVAIHNKIGDNHIQMYETSDLEGLAKELEKMFAYADETGFQYFHNSAGLGASVPDHEHGHFTNFGLIYDLAKEVYGFDEAEKIPSKKDKDILIMPSFPFAHAIFQKEDTDKLVRFLQNAHDYLGNHFEDGNIPHTISQGFDGVLVAIGKNLRERGIGSGDVAGHLQEDDFGKFESVTYYDCDRRLRERLFLREEISLDKLLP